MTITGHIPLQRCGAVLDMHLLLAASKNVTGQGIDPEKHVALIAIMVMGGAATVHVHGPLGDGGLHVGNNKGIKVQIVVEHDFIGGHAIAHQPDHITRGQGFHVAVIIEDVLQ